MKRLWVYCLIFLLIACATTPITGKRYFTLLSEQEENSQGESAYREILSQERPTSNAQLAAQVETIGRRIAAVSGRNDFQWEFRTLESKTPNAFCLPGGKVAVYTGIIPFAQNEAGLATVMGHEVGHALARHGGQRISQQLGLQLGLGVLGATILSDTKYKPAILAGLGVGGMVGLILPYSRSHESEADEIGLVLMAQAGYDPQEAPRFWERFAQVSGGKDQPEFLSTHPSSLKRKEALMGQLPKAIPLYNQAPQKFGLGKNLSI